MQNTYAELEADMIKYPEGTKANSYNKIKHLINLKQMAEADPVYFHYLSRSLGHGYDPKMIENLTFTIEMYKLMKSLSPNVGEKIQALVKQKKQVIKENLLNLDLSVPRLAYIKDFRIETVKRGNSVISYEFLAVREAVENEYGFYMDNIYGDVEREAKAEILKSEFGFNEDEINVAYRIPPVEDNVCAKMLYAIDNCIAEDAIPYLNYWHYLLKHDFVDFRRSGTNYMQTYSEETKSSSEHILFQKFREIYTLEVKADGQLIDDVIPFHIDW